ncbi:MAG: hypothetical protein RR310_06705 [Eubacterium sp.]
MIKKRVGPIVAILMVAILLAGCSQSDGKVSKSKYLGFLMDKFTSMTASFETVKTNLANFSEASLSDEKWVTEMIGIIDKVNSECDEIINFKGTPDEYTNLQTQLVNVANEVKPALNEYKKGIQTKDFAVLSVANDQLNISMGSVDQYIAELKNALEHAQEN